MFAPEVFEYFESDLHIERDRYARDSQSRSVPKPCDSCGRMVHLSRETFTCSTCLDSIQSPGYGWGV